MESSTSAGGGGSHHPRLPPGFRFHPTDEELVVHYLKKRAAAAPLPAAIIAELDLYKYDPWELPSKASFGEQEWYFFSPRERKYPNGERPNRAATSGYWKATGVDKPVMTANGAEKVGVKKALVFYGGKPPKGIKTNWIMHEYRLIDNNNYSTNKKPSGIAQIGNKSSSRLDDWVLCRIFKKNNSSSSRPTEDMKMPVSMPTPPPSMDVYRQSPNPGVHGNGFAMPGNPMSISPLSSSSSSSRSDYAEHILGSTQCWNGNGTMFSSNHRWESGDDHKNLSFISLLNNQFPQNSLVNNPGDGINGILDQSCQLPNSSFQ